MRQVWIIEPSKAAVPLLFSLHFFQALQGTSNFSLHFKIFWPQSQPSRYMELSQNFGACNPLFFPPEIFLQTAPAITTIRDKKTPWLCGFFFGGILRSIPCFHIWFANWTLMADVGSWLGNAKSLHSWKDGCLGKGKAMKHMMDVWKIKGITKLRRSFKQFIFCTTDEVWLVFFQSCSGNNGAVSSQSWKRCRCVGGWKDGRILTLPFLFVILSCSFPKYPQL